MSEGPAGSDRVPGVRDAEVQCYVGVGSNIDPETHIPAALEALHETPGVRLIGTSTFYRTAPIGAPGTPDFYNGVVSLKSTLRLAELTALLEEVETRQGRDQSPDRHGPRTIDLDLLLYGDLESTGPSTVLPHRDIATRAFVAVPLAELAPDLTLPGDLGRLAEVAAIFAQPPGEPLTAFTTDLRRIFAGSGA